MISTNCSKRYATLAVCLFFALSIQFFDTKAARAERQVTFPDTKKPVGTLMIHLVDTPLPLKMIAKPKGMVIVPDDRDLYLIATPEGMQYFDALCKLKPNDLQHLRLHDVPISEGNLKTLSKMTGLTNLDLSCSDINDSALQYIAALKNLKRLDISSTLIHGMSLNKLKSLPKIENLDIGHTRIHDFAVNTIVACCPKLQSLILSETLITDNAILKLAKLKALRKLKVSRTSISDKYLDKLLALKNLQKVTLSNTKVTQEKLRELRKIRPDCKFVSKETDD